MELDTKHFGKIQVSDDKIIDFKSGLPGFPHLTQFILLSDDDAKNDDLFYWLQSTQDKAVAFVMVNMVKYMPEYDPLVETEQMADLGEYSPDQFVFYNVAVFPEDIKNATVNLKAPVVINEKLKLGKQVICTNEEYTVRHYMFQ